MKILTQIAVALLVLASVPALAQPLKIGFINGFRIESESEPTKRAIEQIKKEFAPREAQLQSLQKQGLDLKAEYDRDFEKLKPADRVAREKRLASISQQFEQAQRNYAEDMELRQREVRSRLVGDINAVITAIAETEKFDLILQQAIYTSGAVDLTDRVIKELAKRTAAQAK